MHSSLVLADIFWLHGSTPQPENVEYIKQECLIAVRDPLLPVQQIVGSLIGIIAKKGGLNNWPQLLPSLYEMLDSEDDNVCEGAFIALRKICESSTEALDSEELLDIMILKFFQLFKHSSPRIRSETIRFISKFITNRTAVSMIDINRFIENLFRLSTDEDFSVRMMVCHGFVKLLEKRMDCLLSIMNQVIEV